MTHTQILAAGEGFNGEAERRKRLGQYFTGISLARLLAALAGAEKAASIVDPMVGSGDMLAACMGLGAKPRTLGAVDIDPISLKTCSERVPKAGCILGNAFDPNILSRLPHLHWDLVITNPPYVRYQSMARGAGRGFKLPSALEVRNGLLKVLAGLPALEDEDRTLFTKMASGYSGLADLAVPSWILCAALVAPGGSLALVVPEAWLSRDYATVVHYLLLRWFKIEFIVEDEHAAWFIDTQVKTTLLVARRRHRKDSAFDYAPDETFLKVRLSGRAIGVEGVIDRLYPDGVDKEKRFAEQARTWLTSGSTHKGELLEATHVPLARVAANLKGACVRQKWFAEMKEEGHEAVLTTPLMPQELAAWVGSGSEGSSIISLEGLGVHVGQGLRTGANAFFYADARKESGGFAEIVPGVLFEDSSVKVPSSCVLPVLHRQFDLPDGYAIRAERLRGRVLAIREFALSEDIRSGGKSARIAYAVMPKELASFVRSVARLNIGTDKEPRFIPDLSAVATNVRGTRPGDTNPPRFWYMLPDFAPRHRPNLVMARVNSASPKTFLNEGRAALVDANFSGIWLDGPVPSDAYALLALLNSSWCRAALELSSAVMGGGALKVEATHLRRLPVPMLDASGWKTLSGLGRKLVSTKKKGTDTGLLNRVDSLVNTALLGRSATTVDTDKLRKLATDGFLRRNNQKKGRLGG